MKGSYAEWSQPEKSHSGCVYKFIHYGNLVNSELYATYLCKTTVSCEVSKTSALISVGSKFHSIIVILHG